MVKTAASHAVNIGSNPVRVTKLLGGIPERKGIDNEEKGCYNLAVGSGNAFNISDGSNPSKRVGNDCDEGPPVPIPNTEVKLICADNTLRVTARKDRYCQHKYEEQQHKLLLFLFSRQLHRLLFVRRVICCLCASPWCFRSLFYSRDGIDVYDCCKK